MKTRALGLSLCLLSVLASAEEAQTGGAGQPVPVFRDIEGRLRELIAYSEAAQFKTAGSLPPDRSFTVGEYPALVDFLLETPGGMLPLIPNVLDASGSSFMGLWFLSQSHRVLADVDRFDPEPLRHAIRGQIERARRLPQFFQGTSQDVWACPRETMGWYPLVAGHRVPALVPDWLEWLLPPAILKDLANLSDGDIWAWCMAVDDTTPGILQYHHPITAVDIYAPLLGSGLEWSLIDPESQLLYLRVRGRRTPPRFPIGTFYNYSMEKKQRFSTVVNANILSSIPLLEEVPTEYSEDIVNATSFVRDATYMALIGQLPWEEYAYDYYTIPVAPIAYVARAHKRILEIGRPGYPTLLDERALTAAVRYISRQARRRLRNPNLYRLEGAEDYASLVYCFNAMMNLRYTDRRLFDKDLVDRTMRALLKPNPASHAVPGTGPYQIAGPIWADMASICFVVPPLIESFALYLQVEG